MEIGEKLNFLLQRITQQAAGNQYFVLDHQFTSLLEVGSKVKIAGYALGKSGYTVMDVETIEVNHDPVYNLAFQKSYYVLAREGLSMDLKKK